MKHTGTWRQWARQAVAAGIMAGVGLLLGAPQADAAGLLVADGGFGGRLEIREHRVNVTVNNGIAVTEVTQVFHNLEKRQVEALYTFPVPKGASVSNFSMWINGAEMVGEVVEKEHAREIYDSYKEQRRDPGLLEQKDYKTFEMRIFPIAPEADQKISLTYYQELEVDKDWATYVYPLATASNGQVDDRVQGVFAFSVQVKSAIPITAIESPSHKDAFAFSQPTEFFSEASLEFPEGSLARDVVIACNYTRARTGLDVITSRMDGEDGYFCMTIAAGEELEQLRTGMDYIFVLDISGSMQQEGKLQTSADAAAAFISTLGAEDRFDLLTFNVSVNRLFGELRSVAPENQALVTDFLDRQEAKGGTNLQPAMSAAFAYADAGGDRMLNVVVLSDGMTEQREIQELLRSGEARPKQTRIFCIGVGNEVNRPLLEQMAQQSGGLAAVISNNDNFQRQAQAFRRKLEHPAAEDLALTFAGGEVYDVVPQKLPNLFHGAPVRIYGRYRNPGTHPVTLKANIAGHALDQAFSVELPDQEESNPEIERMWALYSVKELEAEVLRGNASAKEKIIQLGEAYSIATEYTSFLVLENDSEYQRWKIERRNALRFGRDRDARSRLHRQLDALRTEAATHFAPQDKMAQAPSADALQRQQLAQNSSPAAQPMTTTSVRPVNAATPPSSGSSINLPMPTVNLGGSSGGSGGGGAIDPISGGLALGLGALALAARRRKRN